MANRVKRHSGSKMFSKNKTFHAKSMSPQNAHRHHQQTIQKYWPLRDNHIQPYRNTDQGEREPLETDTSCLSQHLKLIQRFTSRYWGSHGQHTWIHRAHINPSHYACMSALAGLPRLPSSTDPQSHVTAQWSL